MDAALHGTAAGNVEVLAAISWRAFAGTFPDVPRRTYRRTLELVRQIGVRRWDLLSDLYGQFQELHRYLVNLKLLVAHHRAPPRLWDVDVYAVSMRLGNDIACRVKTSQEEADSRLPRLAAGQSRPNFAYKFEDQSNLGELMPPLKYRVVLADCERARLYEMISSGKAAAAKLVHARILLKADRVPEGPGLTDAAIADAIECSEFTVSRVKRRYTEEGLDSALNPKPKGHRRRKLDGDGEAQLTALACSKLPDGEKWTIQLLADKLVELHVVESIGREAVRMTLKKNELRPWQTTQWVIPPEQNSAFVAAMEDILEVYKRPYDPLRPVVCLDETTKQLVAEVSAPLPMAPGQSERIDYEYERRGTANIFMQVEPLGGKRFADVTEHRCAEDFAEQLRRLADERYLHAEKIVLVMDNLNTHSPSSLYKASAPEMARRLVEKFEIHYTPKHGSWLDMAEIELSVLSRQCLTRRIPDKETLLKEVQVWEARRNRFASKIDWQFSMEDARIKLKRLYPTYYDA